MNIPLVSNSFPYQTESRPRRKKSRFRRCVGAVWESTYRGYTISHKRCTRAIREGNREFQIWFINLSPVIWFERRYPGWQAGVILGIGISILVFIINVLFLILAARNPPGSDGLGTLHEGDCDDVNILNKRAHILINIMSTCLLMQSNYCMQLLASPTRSNVDAAHRKREWVDVGIQSFRNVWKRHISPWRGLCWVILAISSVPLHLLWNSVIIFSPSAYQYNQLTVTEGFVKGSPFIYDYVYFTDSDSPGSVWPDNLKLLQEELQSEYQIYDRLSNPDCKREYAQSFVRTRSDVIIVTKPKQQEFNTSRILGAYSGGWGPWPYRWLCPKEDIQSFKCYDQIRKGDNKWVFPDFDGPEVEYCLSKHVDSQCKLQYGYYIAIITVLANFLKVICFYVTYRVMKNHTKREEAAINGKEQRDNQLLITTGDAIASFLETPDSETWGMSIVERKDFVNGIWDLRWIGVGPMMWRSRFECSWFRAVGVRRWLFGIIPLAILALVPSFFLLSKMTWLMNDVGLTNSAILQLGIGNPNGLFLFGTRTTYDSFLGGRTIGKVALANTPQLFVSVAYYLWNNHLTAMVATREYDMYAAPPRIIPTVHHQHTSSISSPSIPTTAPITKRSLRVTNPTRYSDQKSTRFLTVPLRYWIPNVILWTLLHYLASQAVFFARVDILDHWNEVTQWSISQVGYSVLGLLYFFASATFVLAYAVTVSLRRLPNRMPLAATCSAAIAAACHPTDFGNGTRVRHWERKVQWGVEVTEHGSDGTGTGMGIVGEEEKRVARCTFTSGEAWYPEPGRWYA